MTTTIAEGRKGEVRSETIRLDPGMQWKFEAKADHMQRIRCEIDSFDAEAVSTDMEDAGTRPVMVSNIGQSDISCTATIVLAKQGKSSELPWARTFVLPPQRRGKLGPENAAP